MIIISENIDMGAVDLALYEDCSMEISVRYSNFLLDLPLKSGNYNQPALSFCHNYFTVSILSTQLLFLSMIFLRPCS